MKSRTPIYLSFAVAALLTLRSTGVAAQPVNPREGWRPSDWGENDRRGALNRVTPELTVSALGQVQRGEIYELAHPLEPGMPAIAGREFHLTIGGGGPLGENQVVYNDDAIVADLGHVGTHLDALGHVGTRVADHDVYFNGLIADDFVTAAGLEELGIDTVGPIITRGVLIDIAKNEESGRLQPGHIITSAELREALTSQKLTLREGDAVLVRTGYGALWMTDNQRYSTNYPGIGAEASDWLVGQGVVLVGSDNLSVHARAEAPNRPFELHQFFLATHGVYLLENMNLEVLSANDVHEFLFVFVPLKSKGGTGSPGTPLALR
jgi:kynurenine formamidase